MSRFDAPWTDQTLTDPHAVDDKAIRVRRMFAAIASSYDLNNRLHSMGRDQAWRRAAVGAARLRQGETVLDVACGTGDLSLAFARAGAGGVVALDFTDAMLVRARRKEPRPGACTPRYLCADALKLPITDGIMDVVSIAFGIRNVTDPSAVMGQFYRVLRPGGRAVILEFSTPAWAPWRAVYQFYFHRVMPRTASWIAGDRTGAYRYLPRSVDTFLDRSQMSHLLERAGFVNVTLRPLMFGIAVIYTGTKPGNSTEGNTETAKRDSSNGTLDLSAMAYNNSRLRGVAQLG